MKSSDSLELALPARLALATKYRASIQDMPCNTQEYKDSHSQALRLYVDCLVMAENIGLYNTLDIDDLPNSSLECLMLDLYVAELLEVTPVNTESGMLAGRFRVVKSAMRKYYDYLSCLESLDLHDSNNAAKCKDLKTVLPQGRRGIFELSVLMRKNLMTENDRQDRMNHRDNTSERPRSAVSDAMDKPIRKAIISRIHEGERKAWISIRNCWRELAVLGQMLPREELTSLAEEPASAYMPSVFLNHRLSDTENSLSDFMNFVDSRQPGQSSFSDAREKARAQANDHSTRVEPDVPADNKGLVSRKGKIMRPFTITRDSVQKKVMGTGQVLPTMSLDELAELELSRRVPDQDNGNSNKPDEDSMIWQDSETDRLRKWDDFKDNNARGSGNTMNRG